MTAASAGWYTHPHITALLASSSHDSCLAIFPAGLDVQDECDDMDVDGYDNFSDDAGITAL